MNADAESPLAPTVKKRPVKGALSGLVLGFGVALLLLLHGVIASKSVTPLAVVLALGVVVGVVLALAGPNRTRR